MQFFTTALLASVAVASPLLQSRTDWGSCSKDCQYTCEVDGLINAIVCNSILSGNSISIPISVLKRDIVEARGGDECTGPTCCTVDGLLNVLVCNEIGSDNSLSVPVSVVSGL